jgi:hypothetical protein
MATVEKRRELAAGGALREALLADLPVTERRLEVAGIATAVLEGGEETPVVLLHGPGEFAAICCGRSQSWRRRIAWSPPTFPATAPPGFTVPTTLIWGRHDLQVRLRVAEAASARYGWPLHVVEDAADDPAVGQPEAFLDALEAALAGFDDREQRRTA